MKFRVVLAVLALGGCAEVSVPTASPSFEAWEPSFAESEQLAASSTSGAPPADRAALGVERADSQVSTSAAGVVRTGSSVEPSPEYQRGRAKEEPAVGDPLTAEEYGEWCPTRVFGWGYGIYDETALALDLDPEIQRNLQGCLSWLAPVPEVAVPAVEVMANECRYRRVNSRTPDMVEFERWLRLPDGWVEYQVQGSRPESWTVVSRQRYVSDGRLRAVAYPDGTSEHYEYDADGWISARSERDGEGSRTYWGFDERGLVTAYAREIGGERIVDQRWSYSSSGQLQSVLDQASSPPWPLYSDGRFCPDLSRPEPYRCSESDQIEIGWPVMLRESETRDFALHLDGVSYRYRKGQRGGLVGDPVVG